MAGRADFLIVVVDASVLVSAVLKQDSVPEAALFAALSAENRLIISQPVEDEYRDVLARPKFDRFVSVRRRTHILGLVLLAAERVAPIEQIRECSDPNDDKYLSLAAAGQAEIIVTSDEKHLLPMHPWRGIALLRPAEFLSRS